MKGAAVLMVALLLGLMLRRVAAARRYALWITAIVALAVLPLAMWVLPAWRVLPKAEAEMERPLLEPEPEVAASAELAPGSTVNRISFPAVKTKVQAPAKDQTLQSPEKKVSWQDVVSNLPLVWVLVASLLLLRLGLSAWRLRRLEVSLQRGACALLEPVAFELGLKRRPRLLIGPADAVPMVWGVFRPRLLLPKGFDAWAAEKQRGVLLHELAHLRRGDPLALWAAQWVKALHWFNPLAWLTLRQLRADQERACDDTVLRQGVRASDYAQALLDLSRHQRLAPGLSLCALTITRCAPVEARVKAILDPKRRREALTLRWLAGLCACALLITLPVAMLHAIEGPALRGRILDRNGVVLAETTKEKSRNYPLKTLAAHAVGYTRPPDERHARSYGGAALEKQQDAALAAGKDVTLTLDARIQALAIQAMKEGGVERGAAVVLDPRTGEILASVSLPSFDPNLFIPTITLRNWESYLEDRDVPLMNRVVRPHAPGASFLPVTALAGIAAGVGERTFTCAGSVTYGSKVLPCWIQRQNDGRHGELDMRSGFVASCNCFWYQYGNAAGIDQIEAMGHKIGFGESYGISEDEFGSILPSPSWLKEHRPGEIWSAGYTANTSIGSGPVLASPLQLAVLAATVGNGGKVPRPALLKQTDGPKWRADLAAEGLPAAQLESLRDAMRLVVNGNTGTGRAARSDRVVIAGRTGTAQNWRMVDGTKVDDNHTWFIGFAPFDKPTLAFAILKTGGKSGGGECAPIAKRIVEETLALPADGSGEVKPVGDELGRAHEKLQQAQAQFDARAERVKAAIHGIKLNPDAGFSLDGCEISRGQLNLHGTAAGMQQALQFRVRLVQLELLQSLDWTFPVPRTLEDGKRVGFSLWGVVRPKVEREEQPAPASRPTSQAEVRQQSDAAVRMSPALARAWAIVKKAGLLADLPASSQPFDSGDKHPERQMKSVVELHFLAPRDAVRRWLVDSHCTLSKVESLGALGFFLKSQPLDDPTSLDWPARPEIFMRTYKSAGTSGQCTITVHGSDNDNVHVTVSYSRPPFHIAPEESQQPRPSGRLAPERELQGRTASVAPPVPALDSSLRTLLPTVPAEEIKPHVIFLPPPGELRIVAPRGLKPPPPRLPTALVQLREEIGPETEPGLLRSLQKNSRVQQTLWVKAAQR